MDIKGWGWKEGTYQPVTPEAIKLELQERIHNPNPPPIDSEYQHQPTPEPAPVPFDGIVERIKADTTASYMPVFGFGFFFGGITVLVILLAGGALP